MIVHASRGVTLIGGAPCRPEDVAAALELAPELVAVDGGADLCRTLGLTPRAVIGDLDSLSERARLDWADRLIAITEQETTDFDKALRHVAAPFCIAVGFSGGRLDHELAVLNALVLRPDRPCIVLGRDSLTFLCPPLVALNLPAGLTLSLFPMGPVSCRSTGLDWPTEGLEFRPDGRIGTSNAVSGGAPVVLLPSTPRMLVILPRSALKPAVSALTDVPRWPG